MGMWAPRGRRTPFCSSVHTVHLPGLALTVCPQDQAVFSLQVILSICPWVSSEPPHSASPIAVSGAGQGPAAPAPAPFCDVSVSLSCALGKPLLPRVVSPSSPPHVLEGGQDFKIRSFCFPGRQQWKGPIGPTVTLCL